MINIMNLSIRMSGKRDPKVAEIPFLNLGFPSCLSLLSWSNASADRHTVEY